MLKKTLFAGIGIAMLAVPLVTSASTLSDLQAQVASLLAQIQALQANGNVSTSVSVSGSAAIASPIGPSCPVFLRSLSTGARGSDVSSLQSFLQHQGYLSVSATGYFGALTRSALGRWQSDNGIAVSNGAGFGIFGPMSRFFYARYCDGNSNGNGSTTGKQSFSADPQSGAAPLDVTFSTSDSINSTATYSVDFGDGSTSAMTKGSCIAITAIVGGQGGIRCSYNVDHVYASNGTYTARLMKNTCPAGAECFVGPLSVASTVVTVGQGTNMSLQASPVSGSAPLSVTFSVPGLSQGSYWAIDFGDGQTASLQQGTATHTYTTNGTFTASAVSDLPCFHSTPRCLAAQQTYGSVTITVGSATNASDQRLNAPGTVTLQQGGVAEIRNQNYYFTVTNITATSTTIQPTPVGCWNSFPSDPTPQIRCMIAVMPTPPITLTVGKTAGTYPITLTSISGANATFSIGVRATSGY